MKPSLFLMRGARLIAILALSAPALAAAPAPIEIGGARLSFQVEIFPRAASDEAIREFIARSAEPVAAYYGKFPVRKLLLEVKPNIRYADGIFGREYEGKRIEFFLGTKVKSAELEGQQILTHEMFHLGFPDLAEDYAWLEEGLATYLAHLSRARVGQTSEGRFWEDSREGFEDAQRRPGEGGFAEEENYHRMYWGGALFWFTLDLEIRERSQGQRSLDTVTRAILAADGSNASKWSLKRLSRAVDQAAGFPVFRVWYERLGTKTGTVDLEAVWKKFGLHFNGGKAVLEPGNALRAAYMKNLP
jgi:hypothetical protein